jgi:hypothetical protein
METGERRARSAGFCGYEWMVDSILSKGFITTSVLKDEIAAEGGS